MMTIPGTPPPLLVGREREQAVLRDHLAAALNGRGSLVLIGGEAGIGKTALAEMLCNAATTQGALVLVGRCYDLTETPPYGPWVELFGRFPRENGPPLPTAFAQRGTVGEVTSQAMLFQQVLDFFIALSAQHPTVLLLDDLHWADPASLDLLRFLARSLAALPLLIIAMYRTDELTPAHPLYQLLPTLIRESSASHLDLQRWRMDDVRTIVTRHYRMIDADKTRLVAYLHKRAQGNPFFTGELLRTLEEHAILRTDDGTWTLGDLTQVRVPALLGQVIEQRLARLGGDIRRILAIGAVIGQEVPLSLWATVAEIDEEMLLPAVERALEAHLLEASENSGNVRFVHALIREVLYEELLAPRLHNWHRRAGHVLAALPSANPDAVAYHFQHAEDPRAIAWLIRAGERAQESYAWLTASERFTTALRLMEGSGATAMERGWLLYRLAMRYVYHDIELSIRYLDRALLLAAETDDRLLSTSIATNRGRFRFIVGDIARGLDEMCAGLEEMERPPTSARARSNWQGGFGDHLDVQTCQGFLVMCLAFIGRFAEALSEGKRFLAWPTTSGVDTPSDVWTAGNGCLGLGWAYYMLGRPEEAKRAYARAGEAYRTVTHRLQVGATASNNLHLILAYWTEHVVERRKLAAEVAREHGQAKSVGHDHSPRFAVVTLSLLEGDWDEAGSVLHAVINTTVDRGGRRERAMGLLGMLAHEQGKPIRAWELVRELLPEGPATEPGNMYFGSALEMQRLAAQLCLDTGDLATARTWIESHDRWLAWSSAVLGQSEGQALWARYYQAIGDMEQAFGHAERALTHSTEPRQPLALIAAHRLLGELDTDAQRFDAAQSHLDASLALADACQAPYERALTLLGMAELHAATNQPSKATTLLETVRAICEPLGAKPALARANILAAHLASATATAPLYPAGLSAREIEVLRLVAAGHTNRQIADALSLSTRTIDVHVRNLFAKTGTENRAGATAFAFRHDLA